MIVTELKAVPDAVLATDLLPLAEQHPQSLDQNCVQDCTHSGAPECAPPKAAAAHASIAAKHFPYARIDRNTVRRTRRLGPALSLSTMRRVYPDEDAAASVAA